MESKKLLVSHDCIFYKDVTFKDWLKCKEIMRTTGMSEQAMSE